MKDLESIEDCVKALLFLQHLVSALPEKQKEMLNEMVARYGLEQVVDLNKMPIYVEKEVDIDVFVMEVIKLWQKRIKSIVQNPDKYIPDISS